ncbi:hypothetical protein F0562_020803 [Nyssa sinensis]|uniref:Uncharacterized protein n=1 Tax=Nyssa sinensis TaxID=561372 RepID=A0A5J5BSU2_9ASTE|nr:hypothetical protein F0562_020803 [Nyssa sinensis]
MLYLFIYFSGYEYLSLIVLPGRSALLLHFTFEEDCFPMDDACKPSQGFSNPIFTRVMSVVMGIVTMVRLTGNMPRKLTDATLYSSSMCRVAETTKGQFHVSC